MVVIVAVMVVIVVMIMIMMVVVTVMIVVVLGKQFFLGDRLVGDIGEFEDVVDHLLLEDRRTERLQGVRIIPVVVDHLLLLLALGELTELGAERLLGLLLGHLDLGGLADLGENQA